MRFVQRCEDDVEAFEHGVGEVEAAVFQDVDLAAMQHGNLRVHRPDVRNLLRLSRNAVDRQIPRGGGTRRVIRDRDVFVPRAR